MSMASEPQLKVESGIQGFDEITGGGIPRSAAIALIGQAGAGKELLARHLAWNLLNQRSKVLYASITQAADELRHNMLSYGWDVTPFEENNQFRIVDVFTHSLNNQEKIFNDVSSDETGETFQELLHKMFDISFISDEWIHFLSKSSIKDPVHTLCIFDSFSPLFSTSTKGVFQMIAFLKTNIKIINGTGIFVMDSQIHNEKIEKIFLSLADAIIEVVSSESQTSFIRINKYPSEHKKAPIPFEITELGVNIIPVEMPDLM